MKKEIPYLHGLRCLAMVLVIALHSVSPYIVNPALYGTRSWWGLLAVNALARAGVPLFFMISGYLLLSQEAVLGPMGAFYKKRLPRILIPLLIWNAAYYLYFTLTSGEGLSLGVFFGLIIDSGSAYHLWFVYTLFGIYLLAPFLARMVRACTLGQLVWLEVLVLFAGTLRPIFNLYTGFYLYLFDPLLNGYIGFFILGYILGHAELKKAARVIICLLGVAGLAAGMAANHLASSGADIDLISNGGYNLCHYLTGSAFFVLFKYGLHPGERASRALAAVSGITFGVYLVHVMVMDTLQRRFLPELSPAGAVGYLFVVTTAVSFLLMALVYQIKPIRKFIM